MILPVGFDGSLYPPGQEKVPRRVAIVRANHYAVNVSDYLIAYAKYPGSNAGKILERFEERDEVRIDNLV